MSKQLNTVNSKICSEVQQKLSDIRMLSQIIDSEHLAIFDANTLMLISDRKISHNEVITYIDKRESLIEQLELEVTHADRMKELMREDIKLRIF
jgi:hypothetical protein